MNGILYTEVNLNSLADVRTRSERMDPYLHVSGGRIVLAVAWNMWIADNVLDVCKSAYSISVRKVVAARF